MKTSGRRKQPCPSRAPSDNIDGNFDSSKNDGSIENSNNWQNNLDDGTKVSYTGLSNLI